MFEESKLNTKCISVLPIRLGSASDEWGEKIESEPMERMDILETLLHPTTCVGKK